MHSCAATAYLLMLAVLAATTPLRSAALKIMLPEDGRECISQSLDAELFEVLDFAPSCSCHLVPCSSRLIFCAYKRRGKSRCCACCVAYDAVTDSSILQRQAVAKQARCQRCFACS